MTKQEKYDIEIIMLDALKLIESLKSEVSSLKEQLKEKQEVQISSLQSLRRKSLWVTYR